MHKTSGGDEIPGELFQVLEDDAVDVLHSILHSVNLENSTLATRLEKVIFFSIPKKGNTKERSNYHTIALNLPHLQSNAQNSLSEASIIYKQRNSRCSSWI